MENPPSVSREVVWGTKPDTSQTHYTRPNHTCCSCLNTHWYHFFGIWILSSFLLVAEKSSLPIHVQWTTIGNVSETYETSMNDRTMKGIYIYIYIYVKMKVFIVTGSHPKFNPSYSMLFPVFYPSYQAHAKFGDQITRNWSDFDFASAACHDSSSCRLRARRAQRPGKIEVQFGTWWDRTQVAKSPCFCPEIVHLHASFSQCFGKNSVDSSLLGAATPQNIEEGRNVVQLPVSDDAFTSLINWNTSTSPKTFQLPPVILPSFWRLQVTFPISRS